VLIAAVYTYTRKHLVRGLLTAVKGYNCLLAGVRAETAVVNGSSEITSKF
jgi:hypothetical protein